MVGYVAVDTCLWPQVFAKEIAAPLGLRGTYWINTNSDEQRPANPHMSVGCISTPEDVCVLTCMLANAGRIPVLFDHRLEDSTAGSRCRGGRFNSCKSGSSGTDVVFLEPCMFEELVKLQSQGDSEDLSWAFACVHNKQPIPAVSSCTTDHQAATSTVESSMSKVCRVRPLSDSVSSMLGHLLVVNSVHGPSTTVVHNLCDRGLACPLRLSTTGSYHRNDSESFLSSTTALNT